MRLPKIFLVYQTQIFRGKAPHKVGGVGLFALVAKGLDAIMHHFQLRFLP